jgi:hypothetical protein
MKVDPEMSMKTKDRPTQYRDLFGLLCLVGVIFAKMDGNPTVF